MAASAEKIVAALALALVLLAPLAALAQPQFPALAGRVVDAAGVLRPEGRAAIERKLKAHEDRTTDQVVVAIVPSLNGTSVEDYANRLFRHWGLGQKGKNNGVLLLVAPSERKVRIEVGYGLEGALTDALTKVIVATAIAPKFKQGDFLGGIEAGVDAVLSALTGDAEEWQRRAKVRTDETNALVPIGVVVVLAVLAFLLFRLMHREPRPLPFTPSPPARRQHRGPSGLWAAPVPASTSPGPSYVDRESSKSDDTSSIGSWFGSGESGGSSWSSGDSGFSGGGGSSGGGGASGDW